MPRYLTSVFALPTLRTLQLHIRYQINELSWPNQCRVQYLTIHSCTLDEYCTILRHSPLLQVIIIKHCHFIMEDFQENDFSTLASVSFQQVTSLTLQNIINIKIDKLECLLSLTTSLVHLQLTSQVLIFDNSRWEHFIIRTLPLLEKFEFFFSQTFWLAYSPIYIESLIVPFRTRFWLNEKRWFINCDYIKRMCLIKIYSIPVCVSDFEYVIESDKISISTTVTTDNNATITDNVHTLKLDIVKLTTTAAMVEETVC
ncbi:unnamed protein product [Rotaria sp. Silwood1]|nr:unnamed protein product [Rotaria sp. Silwood1]